MWNDDIYVESRRIKDIAVELSWIADAFKTTGNNEMYIQLNEMSITLEDIEKSLREIAKKKVNDDYKTAEQSAWNTVSAALTIAENKES